MLKPRVTLYKESGLYVVFECCQRMGTDLVIGVFGRKANKFPQSLKISVEECLLGSYRWVPGCHTHPEDQIRTCVCNRFICEKILDIYINRMLEPRARSATPDKE